MKGANHSFFSPLMFRVLSHTSSQKLSYAKGFLFAVVHSRVSWIDKLAFATTMPKILTHTHIYTPEKNERNANNITFDNSKIKLGKISIERWHNLNNFFCVGDKSHTHIYTHIRAHQCMKCELHLPFGATFFFRQRHHYFRLFRLLSTLLMLLLVIKILH